jgi:nicotinate-nucleotide adenylyltransferase
MLHGNQILSGKNLFHYSMIPQESNRAANIAKSTEYDKRSQVSLLNKCEMQRMMYLQAQRRFLMMNDNISYRMLQYLLEKAWDEDDRESIRAAAENLRRNFGAGIDILNNPPLPMSSTEVRASRDSSLLPEAVAEYIRAHRLYRPTPEELEQRVQGMVKAKRYAHILGCRDTAVELARKYGADEETVAYAALLHDMTKEFSLEEQLKLAEKWNIILDYEPENLPHLIHADTAAAMAREELGMWDGVCTAIARHTVGGSDMSREDLIVYLADLMEPTRDYPGVEALREAAGRDLREACILATRRTLEFVKSQGREPYYKTARTLEDLMKNTSETEEQK